VTKTLSRGIKSAWRERRVAAESGEPPTTWFQRTVDWIDGRDGASSATRRRVAAAAERGEDTFDPFAAEDAQTTGSLFGASWETTAAMEERSEATTASPEETVAPPERDEDEAETFSEEKEDVTNAPESFVRSSSSDAKSARAARKKKAREPLADARRKPDFVFTMGGDAADAAAAEERTRAPRTKRRRFRRTSGRSVRSPSATR
jgi:chemotaxis protein histidine kinase CheA